MNWILVTSDMLTLHRQKLGSKLVRVWALATAAIMAILLTGCQSPFLVFPGKALEGTVSNTESFAFAESHRLLALEVNPDQPYSVILRTVVIDGELYLDAAPARQWGKLIEEDPRVRVKLDDTLYRATAVTNTDTSITNRFRNGRLIYRLEPGWSVRSPASQE